MLSSISLQKQLLRSIGTRSRILRNTVSEKDKESNGNILPNFKNPIVPCPTEEQIENGCNAVSVAIHGNKLSWCQIARNSDKKTFTIQCLQQTTIPFKPKMHFLSLLADMITVCHQVPTSPVYLMEEHRANTSNPHMFPFQLLLTQMRSYLLGSLATRTNPPQILSIKSVAVAQMFNISVGNERVSPQHLVDNMITWKPIPSLTFPNHVKIYYENSLSDVKEGLSSSLILNLAYWKLTKQFTDSHL